MALSIQTMADGVGHFTYLLFLECPTRPQRQTLPSHLEQVRSLQSVFIFATLSMEQLKRGRSQAEPYRIFIGDIGSAIGLATVRLLTTVPGRSSDSS